LFSLPLSLRRKALVLSPSISQEKSWEFFSLSGRNNSEERIEGCCTEELKRASRARVYVVFGSVDSRRR
jgi:hypothetical protein